MAFGNDNKLELEVEVDTTGAISGLKGVDDAIDNLGTTAGKAGGLLGDLFAGFSIGVGIGAAQEAISQLSGALSSLPDAIARGSEVDDITQSFNNLSESAGVSSDTLINKFSSALGDTIPKVDAMKKANELLLGGLDPSQFELVAKAARSLADVTGGSATEGLDKLSDSLLRGNDKALKNIGITVDNEKAYQKFADSIGTTVDKLTEEAKIQATREAVLSALTQKQSELGDVTNDAADNIDKFKAGLQNAYDQATVAISTNKDLNIALEKLANLAQQVDFQNFASGLGKIISVTVDLSGKLIDLGTKYIPQVIDGFRILSNTTGGIFNFNGIIKSADELQKLTVEQYKSAAAAKENKTALDKLGQINTAITFAKTSEEIITLKKQAALLSSDLVKSGTPLTDFKSKLEKINSTSVEATKVIKDHGKSLNELEAKVKTNTAAFIKSGDETGKKAKKDQEAKKAADELKKSQEEQEKQLKDYNTEILKTLESSDKYKNILQGLKDKTLTAENAQHLFNDELKIAKTNVDNARTQSDLFTTALKELTTTGNISADTLKSISENSRKVAESLKDVKKDSEDAAGTLGEVFSGVFADSGSDLYKGLSVAFEDAFSLISSAINGGKLGAKELITSISSTIGTGIGAVLGGPAGAQIGGQVGSLVGEIIAKISESFNADTAGTKARKSIDKFFADIFDADRLSVVVDGQLKKINDLVFEGNTPFGGNVDFGSSAFFTFFNTLESTAQNAFNGVGNAFAALTGDLDQLSGLVGAALANNIGGSLNNLGILIQTTGKSVEELQGALVDAFLDGKLSASEVVAQMGAIAKAAEKGIPDGIGKVLDAFNNMKAAGASGGRAVVDALQDIGAEAGELGDKTLEQLKSRMLALGIPAQEAEQIYQALKNNGITSVKALTNATAQQLLPVLAQLENQKFPFAAQSEEAKKFAEEISKIPDRKDVEINVKVNTSSEDKKVLEQVTRVGQGNNSVVAR